MPKKLSHETVYSFLNAKIPKSMEDEMLLAYSNCTIEVPDLMMDNLDKYFDEIKLPSEWYQMVEKHMVCLDGTDIVDFDKLLSITYRLLIFMDNAEIIDSQWLLILEYSGRIERYKHIPVRKQVVSIKEIQRCASQVSMEQQKVVEMISCATEGRRVFIRYLDFAHLLGKLGYLRF